LKPNILVIDDSHDLHALIRVRLAKEPVNVLSATDPEEGICRGGMDFRCAPS
jgi:DNA-binding response OmpR family regulator